eukprot:CAMPEP_0183718088 /NCGR_PEP_ID=MMETSP0737-20130205/11435_1 /TAXON_ID=385413 /ORGANISM="Thalassiosira miniscula, Strain CCMP1093" /LENGTH=781 /DNA_ID=CAMNT_0025947577 /DNA_START=1202 /DNA_END=3544 /DNA_ORIENTATION=-
MAAESPEKGARRNSVGVDSEHKEIAAFAALVRQTSETAGDDCNSSLISRDEDERLGLLCHGDEERMGGDSYENSSHSSDRSWVEDDHQDDDKESCISHEFEDERDSGWCRFLLARIKANPSLSIATIFMGALTAYLWTDDRFRFIMSGNEHRDKVHYYTPHRSKSKGKTKDVPGPKFYPTFPAKTLLGIVIHKPPVDDVIGSDIAQSAMSVDPPYDPTDFQYEKFGRKRTLLYWEEIVEAIEQTQSIQEDDYSDNNSLLSSNASIVELWTNISTWGPCYPRAMEERHLEDPRSLRVRKGKRLKGPVGNWTLIVQSNADQITDEESIVYPTYTNNFGHHSRGSPQPTMGEALGGLCRPGFLIIGQGKCGTSSLYHYLTGHPRILPAKEKQIHFFRYHKTKPLKWYYSHFPTIESFLGRGALMTGEASPGYMPYPKVVESVVKRMSPDWKPSNFGDDSAGSGVNAWNEHVRSLPKIIAIVRDPITRAISSYKYNYIEPAMKKLRSGRGISASGKKIPGDKSDKYYRQHHLFTFEELAYAELATLKECLKPGGKGETWSYDKFGKTSDMFFYASMKRRNNNNPVASDSFPSLIHLDEACYTTMKSKSVPRTQWKELAVEHPNKVLQLPNLQLTQSIVGRGVYALPLEWWYEVFSNAAANKEDHIHVVCTEDMANSPNDVMDDLTKFLGLPEFDFTNVTGVGRYNVGGHRGYDTVTKSPDEDIIVDEEEMEEPASRMLSQRHLSSTDENDVDLLAISDALMNELIHFYQPYNERLFHLIGKRCPW